MEDVIQQLVPIFRDVFSDDEIILSPQITSSDIDGWDSLAHIRLVISIEKVLDLSFSADEIFEAQNVGEFAALILRKQADD